MATLHPDPATATLPINPSVIDEATSLAWALSAGVERFPHANGAVLRRRGFPMIALEADDRRAALIDRLASGSIAVDRVQAGFVLSLARLGYVDLHVRDAGASIAVLTFVAPPEAVGLALPGYVRLHDHLLVCMTPKGLEAHCAGQPARLALAAPAVEFMGRLATERRGLATTELSARDRMLATVLAAAGLLDCTAPRSGWDPIDLAFHAKSRHRSIVEPYGPRSAPADVRPRTERGTEGRTIALPTVDLATLISNDDTFAHVTEGRSSNLATSEAAVPIGVIGEMLFRSLRARPSVSGCGLRPYPSGGRVYEIDAYLLVGAVVGLAPGLYRYDAVGHALVEIVVRDADAVAVLGADAAASIGRMSPPPLLIILTADFPAVFDKYAAMPYALVLKHVGIVMHAIGLAAHATGLVARPIGGGRADAFAAATSTDPYTIGSVGEIAIALRAPQC